MRGFLPFAEIPGTDKGKIRVNANFSAEERMEKIILQCLSDHYGIEGSVSRLPGENLNYLVSSMDGSRFVFKIVDDDMPAAIVVMENEIIEHAVSGGFRLKLPRILKNRLGYIETRIEIRKNTENRARLIEFIRGTLLDDMSDISLETRKNLGVSLAEFDLVMQDFDHPAAHRNHRWNLAEAGQHRAKLALIEEPARRELLAWAFDLWASDAKPKLAELPHQIIHGDAHGENILMSGNSLVGLVDFGDCCFNPTICELGVCLPYMMMGRDNPEQIAIDIISAYHRVRPLSKEECAVILPLICGRLAVTVSVAAERRRIDPSHPNWFDGEENAWNFLRYLFGNYFGRENEFFQYEKIKNFKNR